MTRSLILDTETTGLPFQEWARLVEIGAVVHENGREVASYSSLVYPDILDARAGRALARNRIPVDALLSARGVPEVRAEFRAWLASQHVTEVWAYGRAFDEPILVRKFGVNLPWTGCVLRLARRVMPKRLKDPPLQEAARHFGIPVTTTHRALDDARLAAGVLAAIRRR